MNLSHRKNSKLKITLCFLFALLCLVTSAPVKAEGYSSYIYDENMNAVPSPTAALPVQTIHGIDYEIGAFLSPKDLVTDSAKNIYIADTENNRIVILNGLNQSKIVSQFEFEGKTETLSAPEGVFVGENGSLYVADTGNARIWCFDKDFKPVKMISSPQSADLPSDFFFKPTKITVDQYDRIFVVSEGYNQGLMEFDADGRYIQSMGAPRVAVSLIDRVWRKFMTKEQIERNISFVPTEYSNVAVDKEGFLFVTTSAYEAWQYEEKKILPLQRLNSKGNDVLVRYGNPAGDKSYKAMTYTGPSTIVDVCEIGFGNYAILDSRRGRIFAYSAEGELLYQFGGPGEYTGGLVSPSALAYSDGKYYVLDSSKSSITVYDLTEYGELFHAIGEAKENIDYKREEALWQEVLNRNANNKMALRGLGTAAYKNQNMEAAMAYFKLAGDQSGYSKAYSFVRRSWIESYIGFVFLGLVILIAALVLAAKRLKSVAVQFKKNKLIGELSYSGYIIRHPLDGFWDLKREKRGSIGSAMILFVLSLIVMVASGLFSGFIFNPIKTENYSLLPVLLTMIFVFLWMISQWAVTSLMNGEGKLKDIFIYTAYILPPYILLNTVAILLSNVLLVSEKDFYFVIVTLAVLWMGILLLGGFMNTHNFTLAKTILSIIIILVVILLIIFIAMLLFALSQQFIGVIKDLIEEISLRSS